VRLAVVAEPDAELVKLVERGGGEAVAAAALRLRLVETVGEGDLRAEEVGRAIMDGVGQARLAAAEEVGEAAAHRRGGVVPQVETQLGESHVAAEAAAGPDEAPVGVVVKAHQQPAEALIADSDEGVARCERSGAALVVDPAL